MSTTPQDPSALPLQREGETPEQRDARFYGEPEQLQPEPVDVDPGDRAASPRTEDGTQPDA